MPSSAAWRCSLIRPRATARHAIPVRSAPALAPSRLSTDHGFHQPRRAAQPEPGGECGPTFLRPGALRTGTPRICRITRSTASPSARPVCATPRNGPTFFFHNGRFGTLEQVMRFYVTRDTAPQDWYARDANGKIRRFDDLPSELRANVNTDPPFNRLPGDKPALDAAGDRRRDRIPADLERRLRALNGRGSSSAPDPGLALPWPSVKPLIAVPNCGKSRTARSNNPPCCGDDRRLRRRA